MSTLITPEAILSYPNLFEPKAASEGGELKYSCALVFPAGTDLSALQAAAQEALLEKFGPRAQQLLASGAIRSPFRRDAEEKGYPAGSVFVNVSSKAKPGIVSRYAGPDGKPLPITNPDEIYPGCFVRASVRAYAYDRNGNRGVAFGLNNLQKLRDGDRLDSRRRAEDEFDADASAPADLGGATPPWASSLL